MLILQSTILENQRGWVSFPKPHSQSVSETSFDSRLLIGGELGACWADRIASPSSVVFSFFFRVFGLGLIFVVCIA